MSGRQDSNLRPPGPKPGAITNYATPRTTIKNLKADANVLLFSFYQAK